MRLTACSQGLCVLISALVLISLILDAPHILAVATSILVLLIIRYFIFMHRVRITLETIQIVRSCNNRLIRQGNSGDVTVTVDVQVPDHMLVDYSDISPDFCFTEGTMETGSLSPGHHTSILSYSVTSLIHGSFILPGGSVTLSDPFYSLVLPLSRDDFTGPVMLVQPYPVFDQPGRKPGSGKEREKAGIVQGSGIRSFRPYLPGDDLRHVDWKLSARRGSLFVREYSGQEEEVPMLIVDLPDYDMPEDATRLSRLAGVVSGCVESSLLRKEPVSLVLISGPNFCDISYNERDMGGCMQIIREQIHPQVRLHSWYRKLRHVELRDRARKMVSNDEKTVESVLEEKFSARVRILSELHLRESRISQFQARMARTLSGRRITDMSLFTLGEGDLSHIHEIAEVAHYRNIRFHVRIPSSDPRKEQNIRTALKGISLEIR